MCDHFSVCAQRRNDGQITLIEQDRQQACIDLHYVADVAKVDLRTLAGFTIQNLFRRPPLSMNNIAVNT